MSPQAQGAATLATICPWAVVTNLGEDPSMEPQTPLYLACKEEVLATLARQGKGEAYRPDSGFE